MKVVCPRQSSDIALAEMIPANFSNVVMFLIYFYLFKGQPWPTGQGLWAGPRVATSICMKNEGGGSD